MSKQRIANLVSDLFDDWQRATNKAKMLDLWMRGENRNPLMPLGKRSVEMEEIYEISSTPWARLLIGSVAQGLSLLDHREGGSDTSTATFVDVWKPNGLISRQGAVYRSALAHNLSYVTTLPGRRPHTGLPTVKMRGVSAKRMVAFYDDEEGDDFPTWALWGEVQNPGQKGEFLALRLYDDERSYYLAARPNGTEMEYISEERHDVGVTPVHRFAPHLDLDGRATGEVEPFIPMLRRLDQDSFDRLVVQRFNSWRIRFATGLETPQTDAERRAAAAWLEISDILVSSNKDARFGTLDPTDIKQYIDARDSDIRELSAVSQTPPHYLLGQMANLSAEALASAEASLVRKIEDYKLSFEQSWDQALRSCAFILARSYPDGGYEAEAVNYETQFRWADSESRSLAQAVDALGKIATQLEVPVEMLWEQIPFWEKDDTERAKNLLADRELNTLLGQFLDQDQGQELDATG